MIEIISIIVVACATSLSALFAFLNWKRHSKVEVSCMVNAITSDAKGPYVVVRAINKGNTETTITHLFCFYYTNKLLRKRHNFIIKLPPGKLPYKLVQGGIWSDHIVQANLMRQIGKNKTIYCGIHHSMSEKPAVKKIILDEASFQKSIKAIEELRKRNSKKVAAKK